MEEESVKVKERESIADEKLQKAEELQKNEQKIIKDQVTEYRDRLQSELDTHIKKMESLIMDDYRAWFVFLAALAMSSMVHLVFTSVNTLMNIPAWGKWFVLGIGEFFYSGILEAWIQAIQILHQSIFSGLMMIAMAIIWNLILLYVLYQILVWVWDFWKEAAEKRYNEIVLSAIGISSMMLSLTYYEIHGSEWQYTSCWVLTMFAGTCIYHWQPFLYATRKLFNRTIGQLWGMFQNQKKFA